MTDPTGRVPEPNVPEPNAPQGSEPIHEDIRALAPLLGAWEGSGRGSYPTVEAFTYRDHTSFSHDGRPFLWYEQRTWRAAPAAKGMVASHCEIGFWRVFADGRVEAVIAQTGGVNEVALGRWDGSALRLETVAVDLTPSAKDVRAVWRTWHLDGDTLHGEVEMAAVGQHRTPHLHFELRRLL